jgi:thioredoxin 2
MRRCEISTVNAMTERLITCPSCGTKNRLPSLQPGRKAVCGKCKTVLPERAGGPVEVTDTTFATEVEQSAIPVLLDMWADWCGPCHMLAPTIDQLSSELAGRVKVAKLNIDENPGIANRFGVRSIPTLLVLKDGREVDRLVGVQPKQEIVRRLDNLFKP